MKVMEQGYNLGDVHTCKFRCGIVCISRVCPGLLTVQLDMLSEILTYYTINNNLLVECHYTYANTTFSALHIPYSNLTFYNVNDIFILHFLLFGTRFFSFHLFVWVLTSTSK